MRSWSKARRLGLDEHSLCMWTYRQHHNLQMLLSAANWKRVKHGSCFSDILKHFSSLHSPVRHHWEARASAQCASPTNPTIKTVASPEQRVTEEKSVRAANTDASLKANYHMSEHIEKGGPSGLLSHLTSLRHEHKHWALTCAAFFLGPLGGWGQISETQDASNQP